MKRVWIRSKENETSAAKLALTAALEKASFTVVASPKEKAELAISIGGDGTYLAALRELGEKRFEIPVLGLHSSPGRGFLLPLRVPTEAAELGGWAKSLADMLKKKDFRLEERWGLEGRVLSKSGKVLEKDLWSLNDIVVSRSTLSRLVWLRLWVDGKELLSKLRGDGVIVSSSPGSTAYSLSAGGPIALPELRNMFLTPICPQTLAQRTVVLGEKALVRIDILENDTPSHLTTDGQVGYELPPGQSVEIRQARRPVKSLLPKKLNLVYEDFFQALRDKLGFGGNR